MDKEIIYSEEIYDSIGGVTFEDLFEGFWYFMVKQAHYECKWVAANGFHLTFWENRDHLLIPGILESSPNHRVWVVVVKPTLSSDPDQWLCAGIEAHE